MKRYLVLVTWKSPIADFTGTEIQTKVLYEFENFEGAKSMANGLNERRKPNFFYTVVGISIPKTNNYEEVHSIHVQK